MQTTQPRPHKPLPLRQNATAAEREAYCEALAARTPDRDITPSWLRETLAALPLPRPAVKVPYVYPVGRHARYALKLATLGRMIGWLAADAVDVRYDWRSWEVRQAFGDLRRAWAHLVDVLAARGEDAPDVMSLAEAEAIELMYAHARAEGSGGMSETL